MEMEALALPALIAGDTAKPGNGWLGMGNGDGKKENLFGLGIQGEGKLLGRDTR